MSPSRPGSTGAAPRLNGYPGLPPEAEGRLPREKTQERGCAFPAGDVGGGGVHLVTGIHAGSPQKVRSTRGRVRHRRMTTTWSARRGDLQLEPAGRDPTEPQPVGEGEQHLDGGVLLLGLVGHVGSHRDP